MLKILKLPQNPSISDVLLKNLFQVDVKRLLVSVFFFFFFFFCYFILLVNNFYFNFITFISLFFYYNLVVTVTCMCTKNCFKLKVQ